MPLLVTYQSALHSTKVHLVITVRVVKRDNADEQGYAIDRIFEVNNIVKRPTNIYFSRSIARSLIKH